MNYVSEDKTVEVIREGKKKRDDFVWCKWAAGAWEAEFYANTPAHMKSRARTLRVMMNDGCWYSTLKTLKNDTRKMRNKIEGTRKPKAKRQERQESDE